MPDLYETKEGLMLECNFHRSLKPALKDVENGLVAIFSGSHGVIQIVKRKSGEYECVFTRRFHDKSFELLKTSRQVEKWFAKWIEWTREEQGPLVRDLKRKVRALQKELRELKAKA